MEKKKRKKKPNKHRAFLNEHRHKYDAILKKQGGHCALCSREPKPGRRLNLDHAHTEPMRLRGVLCYRCNVNLREWMTKEWLRAAAKYVDNDL